MGLPHFSAVVLKLICEFLIRFMVLQ